jgi:predicted Zn-dependent peptidase
MASRLFRNLREEKGYTYGIYARGDARKLAGASVVVGSVKADVTGPALKELLFELQRLREEPVPAQELEEAKASLILSLPAGFATAGGTAAKIADLVVNGLPDDYWNRYAELVSKVTAEDVKRFAESYLVPGKLTLVMVAHPDTVQAQLAGLPLGPVEVRAAPSSAAQPAAAAPEKQAPSKPAPAKPASKQGTKKAGGTK